MACLTKCSHLTPVLNLTFALRVDEEQGARKEMRKCSWKKQNAVFVSKLKQSFGINTDGATIVYINEAYICSTFFRATMYLRVKSATPTVHVHDYRWASVTEL